ncbi:MULTISPECIES: PIG-L deacetylase family protein [Streptomyces]|uniref:4-oxalmesaconate hydratase n=1 Tax=Streptomyces malaysiensis TaxID=92644 RepID=A0A2J7Z2T3_STRMQ|nr:MULTISPECIES: PIG-L deacetylase family protein [Streptomyces]MCD9586410.1 PIG-L family deacetylase [Streptomyces sp. 8ZJF_21]MCM3804331.1 PIG-L family deacetylase [Streptomyces sp. DR7-3]PNG94591.1 4-oxalmesaconate hydratase [Streptomyces malaysiensis]WHX23444.1 PIG-L deacetylase family protein [Streptomyces sp. NA07423]
MTLEKRPSIQVISAHSGDFVWRAGGTLALYAERGYDVRIVCLSYGERGESQGLWKQDGMTLEGAKAGRRAEAEAAAEALGASITFLDLGDYPLRIDPEALDRIVAEMRAAQPEVLLTHVASDPYNRDHNAAHEATLLARQVAQAAGHDRSTSPIGAPQVVQFEPHQPEQCGFVPNLLLDITSVFDRKRKAMECMGAQSHLVQYYTDLGLRRGVQAVRNGGAKTIVQAEAYQRVFPIVGSELR